MHFRNASIAAAAAALLHAAPAAATTTVDLRFEGGAFAGGGGASTFEAINVDVAPSPPTRTGRRLAGGFEMTGDTSPLDPFVAWCLELGVSLEQGEATYHKTSIAYDEMYRVQKLFDSGYSTDLNTPGSATAEDSAAFQAALWEVVYDDDWDLTTGDFQASDDSVTGIVDAANLLLDAAEGYDDGQKWFLNEYAIDDRQDLIGASPVPAPAGVLLIGSAFGLAAWRSRRARA